MVPVEFEYEKIRVYPLIDKLYRNYQIYRNSFGAKKSAICKIFTPVKWKHAAEKNEMSIDCCRVFAGGKKHQIMNDNPSQP